ncbi:hypothetical protein J6590_041468 [Homalodisca vitripennis]|nr:hypothetical protein J6590_041468 [Homalodisca vitripennis]
MADGIDEPHDMDVEAQDAADGANENLAVNNIPTVKRRTTVKTDSAREWLEMSAKLPPHYARKNSNKLYL